MNKKKLSGFTLIEMIVVIAIIGVLAAILVPSMIGYVQKARYATANANAKKIFDTLCTSAMDNEIEIGMSGISTMATPTSLQSVYDTLSAEQKKKMSIKLDGYFAVVVDSSGYPSKVAWGKTDDNDDIIGRYPQQTAVGDGVKWSNWNT